MKFTTRTGALSDELALALGAASQKEMAQKSLMQVRLEATESGSLFINTHSIDIAYEAVIAADVTTPGIVMLDAKKLSDHVSSQAGETISFENKNDSGRVMVKCGKNTTRMARFEGNDLPPIPEAPDALGVVSVDVLASMLNRVAFAISTEDSRFTITAAQLQVSDSGITAVATDTKKLSLAEHVSDFKGSATALVSKKTISELAKIQSKSSGSDVEIGIDDNGNVFFQVGNRSLFALGIDGRFPKYDVCFLKGERKKVSVKSAALKDTLDRVANFADNQSSAVAVRIEDNALSIAASFHVFGESEESIDISYEGDPISVTISAKYVMEFLRLAGDKVLEVSFKSDTSPVEFRVEGDPTWAVIIMPMNPIKA
jgi:DNA polymerase-3 subunit beta